MKRRTEVTRTLQVGVKSLLLGPNSKILILKKNPNHFKGATAYWEIPGGRVDVGKDLLVNLKREIKEETGILLASPLGGRVTQVRLLAAQDIVKPGLHVVRLTYISRAVPAGRQVTSPRVRLSPEHTEYKWVTLGELARVKPIDPYLKAILKDKHVMSLIKDTLDRQ